MTKIEFNENNQTFKIFADKENHDEFLKILESKNFYRDHRNVVGKNFLEVDCNGITAICDKNDDFKQDLNRSENCKKAYQQFKEQHSGYQAELQKYSLHQKFRIWNKPKGDGKNSFSCDINGDIYSHQKLENLISLIKGEVLIESDKPVTSLSYNPFNAFGAPDVLRDALSPNKSVFRVKNKKQFHPVVARANPTLAIDETSATFNALAGTGLPQETANLLQGLLIFPDFLKGENLEQEENQENNKKHNKTEQIKEKITKFRSDLCNILKLDHDTQNSENILKEITKNPLSDDNKNSIISLVKEYEKEVDEILEKQKFKDFVSACHGWKAMNSLMLQAISNEKKAEVSPAEFLSQMAKIYFALLYANRRAQEVAEIVDLIRNTEIAKHWLFASTATFLKTGGATLMIMYALHKMFDEKKEWNQVQEELEELRNSEDVTEIAKKITNKLLEGKSTNHALKIFGNAAFAASQVVITSGTLTGMPIIFFAGLGATIASIQFNSLSELYYQNFYHIDENIDPLERHIITRPPQLSLEDFEDVNQAFEKTLKQRSLELEILGHLRAPEFLLYQKFGDDNQDGLLGGKIIAVERNFTKWLTKPLSASTDLVEGNATLKEFNDKIAKPKNSKDSPSINLINRNLNAFKVDRDDLQKAVEEYKRIMNSDNPPTHEEAIQKLQESFIQTKSAKAEKAEPQTAQEICQSIFDEGGVARDWLEKKLARAIKNDGLKYNGDLEVKGFKKNDKDIKIAQIDLNQIDDKALENWLAKERKQKGLQGLVGGTKKSVIAKTYDEKNSEKKSAHLRPFLQSTKLPKVKVDDVEIEDEGDLDSEKYEQMGEDFFNNRSDRKRKNDHTILAAPISLKSNTLNRNNKFYDLDNKGEGYEYKDTINQNNEHQNHKEDHYKPTHKTESVESLIKSLTQASTQPISPDPEKRKTQVAEQNNIIATVRKKSRPFVLVRTEKGIIEGKEKTIYFWHDPDSDKLNSEEKVAREIIYVVDNKTRKIEVLYGSKSRALVISDADETTNSTITKIENNKFEQFGTWNENSIFSFRASNPEKKTEDKATNIPEEKSTQTEAATKTENKKDSVIVKNDENAIKTNTANNTPSSTITPTETTQVQENTKNQTQGPN